MLALRTIEKTKISLSFMGVFFSLSMNISKPCPLLRLGFLKVLVSLRKKIMLAFSLMRNSGILIWKSSNLGWSLLWRLVTKLNKVELPLLLLQILILIPPTTPLQISLSWPPLGVIDPSSKGSQCQLFSQSRKGEPWWCPIHGSQCYYG